MTDTKIKNLKVAAYDIVISIQKLQKQLAAVEHEIIRLEAEKQKPQPAPQLPSSPTPAAQS